jgi:Zn-dependent peptidase ImmA (M78 family)
MECRVASAESEALNLRQRLGLSEIPVPVHRLADAMSVPIVEEALDRNVSGLLLRRDNSYAIGVNAAHSHVRQRFTIAHELGHLMLHPGRDLILDHVQLNLRDNTSSLGTDRQERQANAFAAELLMPRSEALAEVRRLLDRGGTIDSRFVRDLAEGFDVSDQAMEYRLVNLGVRRQV